MPNDTYTKAVLTVIAACLVWLCAMHTGRPLEAQQRGAAPGGAQPVVIVGWGSIDGQGRLLSTDPNVPVRIVSTPPNMGVRVTGMPVEPVDVRLDYADTRPLPVGITKIAPVGPWEPVRTRMESEPGRTKPGGGD